MCYLHIFIHFEFWSLPQLLFWICPTERSLRPSFQRCSSGLQLISVQKLRWGLCRRKHLQLLVLRITLRRVSGMQKRIQLGHFQKMHCSLPNCNIFKKICYNQQQMCFGGHSMYLCQLRRVLCNMWRGILREQRHLLQNSWTNWNSNQPISRRWKYFYKGPIRTWIHSNSRWIKNLC